MKKLMYLFVAVIMLAFTACGGSEECATEGVAVDTTAVVVEEASDEVPA